MIFNPQCIYSLWEINFVELLLILDCTIEFDLLLNYSFWVGIILSEGLFITGIKFVTIFL